jgi:flagellar assembly factor FliW
MKMTTMRFGEIEIDEEKIIDFRQGIPGFEQFHQYIIIQPDAESPFSFMQSLEDSNLSLIVTNPFIFYPAYDFELSDAILDELKIEEREDVMTFSIISITSHLSNATINLLAPVIINIKKKLGKQIILHQSEYKTKHLLIIDESNEQSESKDDENASIDS